MTDTAVIFDIIGRDKTSAAIAASSNAFSKFAIGLAAGAAFAGAKFVDMAANFQVGMTRLKTGAGEVDSNMALVAAGIKKMAGEVGESTQDLLSGMYLIESAGFHGAQGLDVLRVAAEGAKVGNADMATVADAVTTGLNAYRMSADKATAVTNALIAAEGQGKTNLEALSGSLATVAPIAAVAGVSLNEVLGAMSTMTGEGTDAASAATYLKQTIGQLSNPTAKARAEMESLGLDATQVSMNLGKNGLASTLTMLTDAIEKHMGPAGTVLIKQLQGAAGNADKFQQILANLPPTQQTYIGALATMTGGTKSMQAALELTGQNMQVFQHNTDVINEKVKAGGSTIEGWADVQKNFNQQMAEAKGKTQAMAISIGEALMPKALQLLNIISVLVGFLGRHAEATKIAATALFIGAAAFMAFRTAAILANIATKEYLVQTNVVKGATLLWSAAQWVLNASFMGFPLVWIIVGIAAIVAGIILAIKYHKQIAHVFMEVWNPIWHFMKGIGEWFAGPFVNFFVGMWNGIWGFLKKVGEWFAGPFTNFFVTAAKIIAAPYIWLWHNVFDPVWHGIVATINMANRIITSTINLMVWLIKNTLGVEVMWLWHNVFEPAWHGIADLFTWLWNNVVLPFGNFELMILGKIGDAAMWLWHNAIDPAIHGIADAAMWLWHNVFVPVGDGIMWVIHGVANIAMWLWHNAIEPAMHGVADAVGWGRDMIVGALNWVMDRINAVGSVMWSVMSGIGSAVSWGFGGAVSIAKGILNSFISVINGAISGIDDVIRAANAVPGVDFPYIPHIPHLATGGLLTRGGLVRVGERGAETVMLPAGAAVYPHGSVPAGGGGGIRETVLLAPGNELGRLIIQVLRQALYGRDVQVYLGGK